MDEPFSNGRNNSGRFRKGCKAGPGSPSAGWAHDHRRAALRAVSPADVEAILKALLAKALGGDVAAAREVLDRTIGKAAPMDHDGNAATLSGFELVAALRALCMGEGNTDDQ